MINGSFQCRVEINRSQVTTEEGVRHSKEHKTMFIETSAKAGRNVKPLFERIAQALPGVQSSPEKIDGLTKVELDPQPKDQTQESRCQC
jgi:Ras-related protein Rab-6A